MSTLASKQTKAQKSALKNISDSETYETLEYKVFEFDNRNRPINPAKVNFFVEQFKKGKFYLKDFPAVINDSFVVLDGQHRIKAAEILKLPVFFKISEELEIQDVPELQLNAGWSSMDYLNAYAQQGNKDYKILKSFVELYKLGVSATASLLADKMSNFGLKSLGFQTGQFKVTNFKKAELYCKRIWEFEPYVKKNFRGTTFVRALCTMMDNEKYDHELMMEKMMKFGTLLRPQVSSKGYLENLQDIYNYHTPSKAKVMFMTLD
jgi:hypothetical protein